jgi:hypothetical protein
MSCLIIQQLLKIIHKKDEEKFDCPARVYCPPATGLCAVPFTR